MDIPPDDDSNTSSRVSSDSQLGLDPRDLKALKCALLASDGLKQEEIGKLLEYGGQAEVSKLLKYARDKGWLVQAVNWPATLSHTDVEQLREETRFRRQAELRTKLIASTLGNPLTGFAPLKGLHVIPSGRSTNGRRPGQPPEAIEQPLTTNLIEELRLFGPKAADVLIRLIEPAATCAIAWGNTVQSVVGSMPLQSTTSHKEFLPICGEPLNNPNSGLSPSDAARQLGAVYKDSAVHTLQGVPARIPSDLATEDAMDDSGTLIIQRFANKSRTYRAIFGTDDEGTPPKIAQVDLVITGVGNVGSSENDPWFRETQENESQFDLGKISCGNIAGLWLPRPEREPSFQNQLDEINSRWLGISLEHLTAVAKRAITTDLPGVVLLCADPNRRDIVWAALPLVNHLIISTSLAEALLRFEP